MAVNEKMYNELYRCRQDIKKIIKAKTGKTPLVCSDDALWAIADLCPKKLSDFESVPGIGQTFIKSYGQFFITRIRNYEETEMEKTVDLDPSVMDTLKELEKNLVSINKRNRLLYMARIASKYAFDLFDTGEDSVKNCCSEKALLSPYAIRFRTLMMRYRRKKRSTRNLHSFCGKSIKICAKKGKMICILDIRL